MQRSPLPIDDVLPQIISRLKDNASLVLLAPTGAGKTTRVAPAILAAGLATSGLTFLVQPRRLAARAAAARMSDEAGTALGEEFGYQVRFEKRASRKTQVLAVTPGVLIRRLQDDPLLEQGSVIILDEFHERSLETDLLLAMLRRIQIDFRPDMKLIVMSATLDPAPIARYLGDCPAVVSEGRLFPVEIRYAPFATSDPLPQRAAAGAREALASTTGDVLVFLPGVGEIRKTADLLAHDAAAQNIALQLLYGDMPLEDQQRTLARISQRKIVLATNVAETSITIDGVTAVVDTGVARVLRRDPALGLNRLLIERISAASAQQRAGRAGRTAPGVCFRLWTEREQGGLSPHDTPEIARVDLAGPILELAVWGETDLANFGWYETPPAEALAHGQELLRQLGALASGQPTQLGKQMAKLPIHPRLARMLIAGSEVGSADRMALVAAILSERDPFLRRPQDVRSRRGHLSDSDVLDRLNALESFAESQQRDSAAGALDRQAARQILRVQAQLLRLLRDEENDHSNQQCPDDDEAVLRALLMGLPDRVARRRAPKQPRAQMVGGQGVKLAEESAVKDAELFLCVDVQDTGQGDALVRIASAIDRSWLAENLIRRDTEVRFDASRQRVIALRKTFYDDLVLDESPTNIPSDVDPAPVLAREAATRLDLHTLLDDEASQLLERIACLRQWLPGVDLPDWGEEAHETLWRVLCQSCLSLEELRKAPHLARLQSQLTPQQISILSREAPARIDVPSGSSIRLQYTAGQSPVLAVRIQEVFGLRKTPRIAQGKIPVLMHLLGPNLQPQQVTGDLESFWQNTYPDIRKELRRRYPKHSWPDDPLTAPPEKRPQRRK
jgi:ATP-dependent helicase HrpB